YFRSSAAIAAERHGSLRRGARRGTFMRRRDFLGLATAAATWPFAARAQQPQQTQQPGIRLARIGVLAGSRLDNFGPFRETLAAMGYVEGQNIQYLIRLTGNGDDQIRATAAELVKLKVDLIVAGGTPQAQAAKDSTSEIPLVLWAGDLLDTGVI